MKLTRHAILASLLAGAAGRLAAQAPLPPPPDARWDSVTVAWAEGRDPDALRIIKIVYSNAQLDDLKRYRDAGVTEFNVSSSGEIPTDVAGIKAKFAEWGETLVGPIGEL
jgi:hypothetical protein